MLSSVLQQTKVAMADLHDRVARWTCSHWPRWCTNAQNPVVPLKCLSLAANI